MSNVAVRPRVLAFVLLLAISLSSCSTEFGTAMEQGCEGVRSAADAYASGDRETFEVAIDDAMSLGGAVELSDSEGKEQQDEAGAAYIGAKALYTAAYEGVEFNDGEEVWQGKPMDALREQQLQEGLSACENY